MKRILLFAIVVSLKILTINCQSVGLGYTLDIGVKNNFVVGHGYDQMMETVQHNFFYRIHSKNNKRALQFQFSIRDDSIGFENYSDFLETDGVSHSSFNTEGYLKRRAWKYGIIKQHQFFHNPDKFIFAINYGGHYEYTSKVRRYDLYDGYIQYLNNEIRRHNFVVSIGSEMRFRWFTIGYKWEKMLYDVLNHDYINKQPLAIGNSSEMRGMRIDPGMHFIYLGCNFDFF